MNFVNPHQFFDSSQETLENLPVLRSVLASGELFRHTGGTEESANTRVERHLAAHLGKEAAVTLSSGTVGLRLALRAAGVGPGDWVLVSAYSFIACAMAVASLGAVPVPLDMDEPLSVSTTLLEVADEAVAAVMIVHVQGHAVPVARVRALCDALGVPLIEDICQGLGAGTGDGPAGSLADVAVTSFQQSKQVSAGEGGLVAGSRDLVGRVYQMADLGAVRDTRGLPDWDDERAVIGDNHRMTELQAALVLDQLDVLEDTLARQRANRALLREGFGDRVRVLDSDSPAADAASHTLLVCRTGQNAKEFCAELKERSVLTRVVWKSTYLEHGLFRRSPLLGDLPSTSWPKVAGAMAPRIVSVPTSKYIGEPAVAQVVDAVVDSRRHLSTEW